MRLQLSGTIDDEGFGTQGQDDDDAQNESLFYNPSRKNVLFAIEIWLGLANIRTWGGGEYKNFVEDISGAGSILLPQKMPTFSVFEYRD